MRARASLAVAAALLLACALSSLAPSALARSPARRVQAYLLSSAPDSLRDLRAHARSIGVVYPTYFAVRRARADACSAPARAAVTDYAREQHIAVMPRFNCQDGATVHAILDRTRAARRDARAPARDRRARAPTQA